MHEATVAQSLLVTISDEAEKYNARPIAARISCGTLAAINDEALHFAFEAIAKGTLCEDVRLEVEHKPLRARCRNCGESFEVDLSQPKCAKCGGEDFELLPDAPMVLEEIEFQTD